MKKLRKFYSPDGPERIGFILKKGKVIEVQNCHPDPNSGAVISCDDLMRYEDEAIATWHTHPNSVSQASEDDLIAFSSYPELKHYIVGSDGVRQFSVVNEAVLDNGHC